MGMKKKNKAPAAEVAAPEPAAPAPEQPPEAMPIAPELDPARDSGAMQADQFPRWAMPSRVIGRKPGFQVVMRRSVITDVRAHGKSSPDVEVCGVLVGDIYQDAEGPWCAVTANIRGNHASGRNAQVTFKAETWTDIHQQMEQKYPKQRILGWYHSHPGFGIFLSEMDVFIQHHFFSAPWQIAYVDDPKGGDRGIFVWRKGECVREVHLIDEDAEQGSLDTPLHPGSGSKSADKPFREPTRSSPAWLLTTAAVLVGIGAVVFAFWWLL